MQRFAFIWCHCCTASWRDRWHQRNRIETSPKRATVNRYRYRHQRRVSKIVIITQKSRMCCWWFEKFAVFSLTDCKDLLAKKLHRLAWRYSSIFSMGKICRNRCLIGKLQELWSVFQKRERYRDRSNWPRILGILIEFLCYSQGHRSTRKGRWNFGKLWQNVLEVFERLDERNSDWKNRRQHVSVDICVIIKLQLDI